MPNAAFWDRAADKYAASPVKDMASYEKTLERTRAALKPDDAVLEIGCGTGTTALKLAPAVGRLLATDLSQRMVEIARDKAAAEGAGNVRFERMTLDDEKLEPASFDAVLAFNLLHLLDDVPAAVARVAALLKPGGVFVSKTICLAEQSRLWAIPLAVARLFGFAPAVRCLTIAELEAEIVGAGFEIVETGLYPASPPSRFVVARKK